tara:strand:+ start:4080 stop:4574 length:495 start_codon:yes stop_codon:yes gene_type:complete
MEINSIVQLITSLTAITAIGLTYWTLKAQRQHNRISVAPRLCDWLHTDNSSICFDIVNKGLGTAQVRSFEFIVNDKSISWSELNSDIRNYFKAELDTKNVYTSSLSATSYIAQNEKVCILKLHFLPGMDMSSIEKRLTTRYKLKIEYASLYEQVYFYISPPLES